MATNDVIAISNVGADTRCASADLVGDHVFVPCAKLFGEFQNING